MMFHGSVTSNKGCRAREWKSIPKIFFNFSLQSELITISMSHTNYIFVAAFHLPRCTFVVVLNNLASMLQNINLYTRLFMKR